MASVLDYLPVLLRGAWVTVQITALATLLWVPAAVLAGLMRLSKRRIVRVIAGIYIEFFRGVSTLVLLFWLFFALPLLGLPLSPLVAGVLGLGLSLGAYGAEVVREAVRAVPKGQTEATIALNMKPFQRMTRVILPQAAVAMLPPFGNLMIELLKGTSLVSLITLADLTFQAQLLRSSTGESAQLFLLILIMYFVMAYAITLVMRALERRVSSGLDIGYRGRAS